MIDYSLSARLSNPQDKASEKKIYANAQAREVITLGKFAKHISEHGSPYTRDVVVGVITAMVDCLHEQLLLGNKVQLGELGSFYVRLSSRGVDNAEDFNAASDVTAVNVRWDRGQNFGDLLQDADFNLVTTREQQAEAKRASKAAANTSAGQTTSGSTGQQPGTGGTGGGELGE